MISKTLGLILGIFRFHKKKIVAFLVFFVIFVLWLFPFNDLGDLVSVKVSEMTGGQVYVSFENLDLSLIPQPGLSLSNVLVETPFTPSLTAKYLSIGASISGLLSLKPGVSVYAESLLGGNVDLSTRGGDKTPTGKLKQKISLDLDKINMSEVSSLGQLPVKLAGNLSGSVTSQVDFDFAEQPVADLDLKVEKFILPEGNMDTPMGPLALPKLNLNDLVLEGRAEKGSLEISKFIFGKPGGDMYANVSGKVDMRFDKQGGISEPKIGAYDLSIHLQVGEAFKQKAGAFLGILQSYQNGANSYAFRLAGNGPYAPPNITRIQ